MADVVGEGAVGDITLVTNEQDATRVKCAKAHAMLMPFSTSADNFEAMAQVLERGCVADGRGGCSVPVKDLWQAVDGAI